MTSAAGLPRATHQACILNRPSPSLLRYVGLSYLTKQLLHPTRPSRNPSIFLAALRTLSLAHRSNLPPRTLQTRSQPQPDPTFNPCFHASDPCLRNRPFLAPCLTSPPLPPPHPSPGPSPPHLPPLSPGPGISQLVPVLPAACPHPLVDHGAIVTRWVGEQACSRVVQTLPLHLQGVLADEVELGGLVGSSGALEQVVQQLHHILSGATGVGCGW